MKTRQLLQMILLGALLAVSTAACANEKPAQTQDMPTHAEGTPAHTQGMLAQTEEEVANWKTTLTVKMALLDKLGADSLHVDVTTVGGAVTLEGTVDERETKELAGTIAKSVASVTSVQNDIRLEANVDNANKAGVAAGEAEAELKDAVLSTKIRLALVDTMGSDGFRVGTEVANGVVTLKFGEGFAATRRQAATEVVESVEGVSKVVSIDKV